MIELFKNLTHTFVFIEMNQLLVRREKNNLRVDMVQLKWHLNILLLKEKKLYKYKVSYSGFILKNHLSRSFFFLSSPLSLRFWHPW